MIRRRGTAAALILMSVLAGGTPALADEPDDLIDPAVASLMVERGLDKAEATRRIGWQERSDDLADAVEAAVGPDLSGGVWIGSDDDRVTVGVLAAAAPIDALRSTVAALAANVGLEGAGLNVVSVRHSLAKLVEASDWLIDRVEAANEGATSLLTAGGYTTAGNVVRLGIPPAPAVLTPAQQAAVAEARQRYGDMLATYTADGSAHADACSAHYCDVPLRGGVRFDGTGGCTLGFIGRSRANGRLYAITAGHCLRVPNGTSTTSRFASGPTNHIIGPARNSVLGRRGDAGIIEITNYTGWKPRAWVYVTKSLAVGIPGTVRNESYPIRRDGVSRVGLRVCKRGYSRHATSCGRVTELNASVYYTDHRVTVGGLAVADYCALDGDSGGPVFAGNTAYGIHSGSSNSNQCLTYYQGIRGAENLMGFNVSFV